MASKRHKLDIEFIHNLLKKHKDLLCVGIERFNNRGALVFLVRIIDCNGGYPKSFTDAWIEEEVDFSQCVLYKHLFNVELLQQFLETGSVPPSLGEDEQYRLMLAFQKLTEFMDTYKGHQEVWHGSVDILVGGAVVEIAIDTTEDPCSAFELKRDNNLEKHKSQLYSQAIVASCSMKERRPLIAVCKDSLNVFLYDFESDLLFESEGFFWGPDLEIHTVIALWLAINYPIFGLDIDPVFKESGTKSNFKLRMQEVNKLDIYENHMHLYGIKKVQTTRRSITEVLLLKTRQNPRLLIPSSFK